MLFLITKERGEGRLKLQGVRTWLYRLLLGRILSIQNGELTTPGVRKKRANEICNPGGETDSHVKGRGCGG